MNNAKSMLFQLVNEILHLACQRGLVLEDLPKLPPALSSAACRRLLEDTYRLQRGDKEAYHEQDRVGANECEWIRGADKQRKSSEISEAFGQLCYLCLRSFSAEFGILILLKFIALALGFVPVAVLNFLVVLISQPSDNSEIIDDEFMATGLFFCVILATSLIGLAFVNTQYQFRCTELQLRLKGALTSILFSRSLSLPIQVTRDLDLSDAKLATLVQVDVDRASNAAQQFCDLWSLPLQIVVTIGFLYTQVKVAFFTGVIVYMIWLPINAYISILIGRAKKMDMHAKDQRLRVMSEGISSMKSVKLMGLESVLLQLSDSKRGEELLWIARGRFLDAICVLMWACTPVLMPALTFITCLLMGEHLTTAEIFTTLTLLNMLIYPMNAFPWILNGFIEARVSGKRIAVVLWNASRQCLEFGTPQAGESSSYDDGDDDGDDDGVMWFRDSSLPLVLEKNVWCWIPSTQQASADHRAHRFTLGPTPVIALTPSKPALIAVYGRVASGKTSFLYGILNEIGFMERGVNTFTKESVSFCSEQPFLHEGTVLSNILFGQRYFPDRLNSILQGCCLLHDLTEMSDGERTDVGKGGGSMVSGGQRLRIGIARALYANSKVVVLDDPFSALDEAMRIKLFGFFKQHTYETGRIIILTTNSTNMLSEVDGVVHLFDHVSSFRSPSFSASFNSSYDYSSILSTSMSTSLSYKYPEDGRVQMDKDISASIAWCPKGSSNYEQFMAFCSRPSEVEANERRKKISDALESAEGNAIAEGNKFTSLGLPYQTVDEEPMKSGGISLGLYKAYFLSMGTGNVIALLVGMTVMQASSDGIGLFYAWWSNHFGSVAFLDFVFYTCLIVGANMSFGVIRSIAFARGGYEAAKRIYQDLTEAIISYADMSFFDRNSAGRIINRVGKDTSTIDYDLPFVLNNVLAQGYLTIGNLTVICISNPYLTLLIAFVLYLYVMVQQFYRHAARHLRRLEAILRSPIYSLICDCLASGVTIRCMKMESHFCGRLNNAMDDLNCVLWTTVCANQWLSLRLQLLGTLIACAIAIFAVFLTYYGYVGHNTAAYMAVSLSYSFSLTSRLNNLVRQVALLEQEMISFERVIEYVDQHMAPSKASPPKISTTIKVTPNGVSETRSILTEKYADLEAPLLSHEEDDCSKDEGGSKLLKNWTPSRGEIGFKGVHLAYSSALPDALKGLDLVIPGGSRVAIVGRSGSGKSTMFRLLTALNAYHKGSCTIDGTELSSIDPATLRSAMTVIPQDCLLFTGKLRFSLDPRDEYTEDELVEILDRIAFSQTFGTITKLRQQLRENVASTDEDERFSRNNSEDEWENVGDEELNPIFSWSEGGDKDGDFEYENTRALLDFELKNGGMNLSIGQRQLLCLARALMQKKKLVLIDEATSSIDSKTAATCSRILMDYVEPLQSTLLVITHNMHNFGDCCEKVLTLEDGKVQSFKNK